jgi:hypothetical protein
MNTALNSKFTTLVGSNHSSCDDRRLVGSFALRLFRTSRILLDKQLYEIANEDWDCVFIFRITGVQEKLMAS